MQIEPGFELRFSLASVAFNPEDVPEYEKDLPDQKPVWFRFSEDTARGLYLTIQIKPKSKRGFMKAP